MNDNTPEENKQRNMIAFRIGSPHFEQLTARGEAAGMSVHVYTRFLVIQALEQSAILNLNDSVLELMGEVRALRKDFNAAVHNQPQQ